MNWRHKSSRFVRLVDAWQRNLHSTRPMNFWYRSQPCFIIYPSVTLWKLSNISEAFLDFLINSLIDVTTSKSYWQYLGNFLNVAITLSHLVLSLILSIRHNKVSEKKRKEKEAIRPQKSNDSRFRHSQSKRQPIANNSNSRRFFPGTKSNVKHFDMRWQSGVAAIPVCTLLEPLELRLILENDNRISRLNGKDILYL